MVLTNFECWANSGNFSSNHFINEGISRQIDPFNPRAISQCTTAAATTTTSTMSSSSTPATSSHHLTSNGYYGFVHEHHNNLIYNNNNNNIDYDNNNNNNNNNNTTFNNNNNNNEINQNLINFNNVNGSITTTLRCKKRYFKEEANNGTNSYKTQHELNDENNSDCMHVNDGGDSVVVAAKRCRYDDYDPNDCYGAAAEYCNDFFSLPSTQIGTQSCLMDMECEQQQQTQAEGMQLTNEVPLHQLQASQSQQAQNTQQSQQYQHHHLYQGHLHRANRDVSRCLLSHMI